MRARYKGPSGTGIVDLGDDATVKDVLNELKSKTGIQSFSIKYGPPMAMKTIDASDHHSSARSVGLHGETLTIVPNEARSVTPPKPNPSIDHGKASQSNAAQHMQNASDNKPEDMSVPWAKREGTLCGCAAAIDVCRTFTDDMLSLVLRVMPSDNSCLFTAFGGALPSQIPAQKLRSMMADYIIEHAEEYTEAVLGSSPGAYCRSIQDPDRWGGGIELSILSSIFDVQICTFDVQVGFLQSVPMSFTQIKCLTGAEPHELWREQARSLHTGLLRHSL